MGVNSGNTSDFRTWEQSNPKFPRVFGIDSHQVLKTDVFPELTTIKSASPTCFRNWLRSSPKTRRYFGIQDARSAKSATLLITNAPVLTYPDFTEPFTITTNASNLAKGAVLSQEQHLISCYSRTLILAEQSYSAISEQIILFCLFLQFFSGKFYIQNSEMFF